MDKTATKLAGALLAIALTGTGMGFATFAFFSDTGTSTSNTFLGGTLDLELKDNGSFEDNVVDTIGSTNFAPGDTLSGFLDMRNTGTVFDGDAEGHTTDIDLDFSVTDTSGTEEFDQVIKVTTLDYTDRFGTVHDLLGDLGGRDCDGDSSADDGDLNGNGFVDLEDLDALTESGNACHDVFEDLEGPGDSSASEKSRLDIGVEFHDDGTVQNALQGEEVTLEIDVFLAQSGADDLL